MAVTDKLDNENSRKLLSYFSGMWSNTVIIIIIKVWRSDNPLSPRSLKNNRLFLEHTTIFIILAVAVHITHFSHSGGAPPIESISHRCTSERTLPLIGYQWPRSMVDTTITGNRIFSMCSRFYYDCAFPTAFHEFTKRSQTNRWKFGRNNGVCRVG